jgi:hypothetical protein
MTLTEYQAQYFAYELTMWCPSDSPERFAGALVDAQVDLNPHQIEAALFAFRSPLSQGALLADEVGLDKTIEAGLVLSQKWAERKRRILIIAPTSLLGRGYRNLLITTRNVQKIVPLLNRPLALFSTAWPAPPAPWPASNPSPSPGTWLRPFSNFPKPFLSDRHRYKAPRDTNSPWKDKL